MDLSESWMHQNKELSGVLYVDGHVKVYHGSQTPLPRRYISTRRLCLRGITDYWVNDMLWQPFFLVSRQIDRGLLEALGSDIVPQLLKDVPRQPSPQLLEIVDQMSLEIRNLKQERKQHPKHVELSQLPEQHQIKMLDLCTNNRSRYRDRDRYRDRIKRG